MDCFQSIAYVNFILCLNKQSDSVKNIYQPGEKQIKYKKGQVMASSFRIGLWLAILIAFNELYSNTVRLKDMIRKSQDLTIETIWRFNYAIEKL